MTQIRILFWLLLNVACLISTTAVATETDRDGGSLQILASSIIGAESPAASPSTTLVVDSAAVYSNVSNATTRTFNHGGATIIAGNAMTRLAADRLSLTGTPPYSLGGFVFSIANNNTAAVSLRPRVRFYLTDGPAGNPGTLIGGYTFNQITIPANTIQLVQPALTAPLLAINSSNIWAGLTFDDNNGTTGASTTQLDLVGQVVHDPISLGSSADSYFLTTNPGSFNLDNPLGATASFGSSPPANFAWEIRGAAALTSINRIDSNPRMTGTTARWLVTFSAPVTGLSPSNFGLTLSDASIVSVTPSGSPPASAWTVTVNLGASTGTLTLNLINTVGLNTSLTNTLPFVSQPYQVVNNTAPSITPTIGLSRQQGSAASTALLAAISDSESTAASLSVSLVTVPPEINYSALTNNNGNVSALLSATCNATLGNQTLVLRASDASLSTDANVIINVTANTAPLLTYTDRSLPITTGTTLSPTVFSDNGSVGTINVQSTGTYTGSISVNPAGLITLSNAQPLGTHTISIRAVDNCGSATSSNVNITVSAPITAREIPILDRFGFLFYVLALLSFGLVVLAWQNKNYL